MKKLILALAIGTCSSASAAELHQGFLNDYRSPIQAKRVCIEPMETARTHRGIGGIGASGTPLHEFQLERLFGETLLLPLNGASAEASFYRELKSGNATVQTETFDPITMEFAIERIGLGDVAKIRPEMKKLAKSASAWTKECGNQLVTQRFLGARAFVNVHFKMVGDEKARSACSYELYLRSFEHKSGDTWTKLRELLSNTEYRHCAGAEVTVSLLQMGGTVAKLPESIGLKVSSGNSSFAGVTCALTAPAACIQASRDLPGYVFSSDGFMSTVDQTKNTGEPGGPAVTGVTLSDYTSLGLFIGE